MQEFIVGQRWINDAQLSMGLGTVVETDFRTVKIAFLATGESYVYAKESVPLTRVKFAQGDHIHSKDGQAWVVQEVQEHDGLYLYFGENAQGEQSQIAESELNHFVQLNRPSERLFNAQTDRPAWFDLRYDTREKSIHLTDSPLYGLVGGRVSLIPHQLYIAHEVAKRHAPRVLLADEVGLGKTIEAGMIVHQQIVMEQISRVLIVVPEALLHQWMVEMRRRFNLRFKILDAQAMEEAKDEQTQEFVDNPFVHDELVICSLRFLTSDPNVYKACRDANWDMLVVDEAHHLKWTPEESSLEYALIEQLADQIPSVLLLTATPEQLGKTSHFARLRLLDKERFYDYAQFLEQEQQYAPIAQAVEALLAEDITLNDATKAILHEVLNVPLEKLHSPISEQQAQKWMAQLVDRHGTGRALFRNTRAAVKGFPARRLHVYELDLPSEYKSALSFFYEQHLQEPQLLLHPELLFQAVNDSGYPHWADIDPRVEELAKLVDKLRSEKILVITASADSAVDIVRKLKHDYGIDSAVFHEHMSLIERDRAAAFFADSVSGAQVMVCSEMGSEGRNFQFSQNLVLFDLPINPDLLEQRIGRLDRIGQQGDVNIHIMMLKQSAQEIMFNWYHLGLNALEQSCPVGQSVMHQLRDELLQLLHAPRADYDDFIAQTKQLHESLSDALNQGRDRLLEYSSCRQPQANELCQMAAQRDQNSALQDFLENVFDNFGVEYEIHSEHCYTLHAGAHMRVQLSELPEDGMTITYDRDTALSFEDVVFITWSHPLVMQCLDAIKSGEFGNASVTAMEIPGAARGTIFLESIYVLSSAEQGQQADLRFMPEDMMHVLIDQNGKRHERELVQHIMPDVLPKSVVRQVLTQKETLLRKMVRATNQYAAARTEKVTQRVLEKAQLILQEELERLIALKRVNPTIREDEIQYLQAQQENIKQRLMQSNLQLDALRVIIAK